MKDGLIIGAALGMIAGAYLAKNNQEVSKLLDKGEKKIKQEMNKLKSGCTSNSANNQPKL